MNTKERSVTKDAELTNLLMSAIRQRTTAWRDRNPQLTNVPVEISLDALKQDTQAIETYGATTVLKCLGDLEKLGEIRVVRHGAVIQTVWLIR